MNSSIDERLALAATVSPAEYFAAVIEATKHIHERFSSRTELTATLASRDIAKIKELLPVSLILNDRTGIRYIGHGEVKISLPPPYLYREMFGVETIQLNVSPDDFERHDIDQQDPSLAPCFFYSDGNELRPLMRSLAPFIERGSVVFQPSRSIIAKRPGKEQGHNSWHIIGTDELKPLDIWEPHSLSGDKPTPIVMNHSGPIGTTLFEVTIPYLKGVPLKELSALLVDESDLVASFRSALKSAVRDAQKNSSNTTEMVNDVVQPRVTLLERKLRSLQRIHQIKIGGAALGSMALAYTSASTGGVGAGLLALASAGGFGLLANQYSDYLAKHDELRNDPFYLLWKCRQVARKKI